MLNLNEKAQDLLLAANGAAVQAGADFSALLEVDMLLRIALQVALFAASAFFSGSETALFSLSRMDLRQLRRERSPHAGVLHALLDQPRRLIISILCGNMFINVAATANLTGILIAIYGTEKAAWISTFVMVPLLLLLGEATPKTVAVSDPVGISTKVVARPMNAWVSLIAPLTSLIRRVADRITTSIVGEERARENILQVDEFRALVEEGVVSGELTAVERALIYNLLQAGSAEIIEIMTPRTRGTFVDGALPIEEIIDACVNQRRHRIPVYKRFRDNVIGFLHAEDILRLVMDKADLASLELADIMRPPVMVPLTKKVDEMFDYFQRHNVQAACALSEFGGIAGIITMDDVLAYIFGPPAAEARATAAAYQIKAGLFTVPGDMKLVEFNKLTNYGITDLRMTTIAGVVLRHLDRLPQVGDSVMVNEVTLTVMEMDNNRIAQVQASRAVANKAEAPGAKEDAS